jgi:DNA-binding CsgD family transcriptional regulator
MGVFWLPVGGMLEARVCWNEPRHDHLGLEESARERRYARGDGLPGRAWAEREPVAETKPESDMPGAIAFPILSGAEVMAVIELRALEDPGLSERLRRSLIGIGHELGQFLARHRADLEPPALTPRELEVVQLAAQGDSVRGIAERLVLSPATVKTHLEHVYAKLGAPDRAAAVATALRRGLIE